MSPITNKTQTHTLKYANTFISKHLFVRLFVSVYMFERVCLPVGFDQIKYICYLVEIIFRKTHTHRIHIRTPQADWAKRNKSIFIFISR